MTGAVTGRERVIPHGVTVRADGSHVLSGGAARWLASLDAAIIELAGQWSPTEYVFPPVIPASDLERLDYFQSFPQLMTVPATLPADAEVLQGFAANCALDSDGAIPLPEVAPVRHVLIPAACYPVYPTFGADTLTGPRYVTVKSTCFRHESHFTPLRRQWTFTMREVVCIGGADESADFAARAREGVETLTDRLGLTHEWAMASDPFFQPQNNGRALMQRLAPVKVEAVVDDLAISSVNLHHDHFGAAFDIRRDDQPAHSGCLAFGLDRWLGVVANRWGPEPATWPEPGSRANNHG